jgi:hypothetical protein
MSRYEAPERPSKELRDRALLQVPNFNLRDDQHKRVVVTRAANDVKKDYDTTGQLSGCAIDEDAKQAPATEEDIYGKAVLRAPVWIISA